MFIYELECEFFNEQEQDINYAYEYIVHEKEFLKEEFKKMCEEGLSTILNRDVFTLKKFLMLKYGFSYLPIKGRFRFSESE